MKLDTAIFTEDVNTIEESVSTIFKAISTQKGCLKALIKKGNTIKITIKPCEDFITIETDVEKDNVTN